VFGRFFKSVRTIVQKCSDDCSKVFGRLFKSVRTIVQKCSNDCSKVTESGDFLFDSFP